MAIIDASSGVYLRVYGTSESEPDLVGTNGVSPGDLYDRMYGNGGNDVLRAFGHNDYLSGGRGNDRLYGDGGNDKLYGGSGDDRLYGGTGDDRLTGGAGKDWLHGGSGSDSFHFNKASEAQGDTVYRFEHGLDTMNLGNIDANTRKSGNQDFRFIDRKGFTKHAGELQEYHSKGNTYIRGDVDGDGKADFSIKVLGKHDFTMHDLIL